MAAAPAPAAPPAPVAPPAAAPGVPLPPPPGAPLPPPPASAQPHPPPQAGQFAVIPPKPATNGLSIASLILGIVWIGGLGSLLAVIFGFIGKKRIKDSNGQQGGSGLAIAGIILGFLGLAATVLFWVAVLAVTHGVNQFANSFSDGHNYGVAHYSSNGDQNSVCNSAPVPSGDDSTEFNLGCLAGWASAATSSGNLGNSGNSGTATTTTSGNTGNTGSSGNTGNSG